MKHVASPLLLTLVMIPTLFGATTVNVLGATPPVPVVARSAVTFRLQVAGDVPRNMTFWMAYGPLAGRFGIVQLHRFDTHLYRTTVRLPLGRSSFAYIAGYGVQSMPYGLVPGDPVITIRYMERSTARRAARSTVSWHVPLG